MMFGAFGLVWNPELRAYQRLAEHALKTDEPTLSAETLADRAAGFHPMPKPPAKVVKQIDGPQKHDAGAMPMKALRIGWER